jgi:hypothetical protein
MLQPNHCALTYTAGSLSLPTPPVGCIVAKQQDATAACSQQQRAAAHPQILVFISCYCTYVCIPAALLLSICNTKVHPTVPHTCCRHGSTAGQHMSCTGQQLLFVGLTCRGTGQILQHQQSNATHAHVRTAAGSLACSTSRDTHLWLLHQ